MQKVFLYKCIIFWYFLYYFYLVDSLVRQLEEGVERFDEPGKEIAIYRYDGQGHAFLNDEEWALKMRKELGFVGGDNDEIKSLAWGRIYEFFNKYL